MSEQPKAIGLGVGGVANANEAQIDAGLRSHMLHIYNWMASGLLLTGLVAYLIGNTPSLSGLFWSAPASGASGVASPTLLGWVAMLSPLAFILVLSFGVHRLSKPVAQILFWAFAVAMGASLSNIFLRYTGHSIAQTFLVVATTFAATSLYGYTTKSDLSRMGSFMVMGLIGIMIAGLVNLFLASSALAFAISVIGVIVFVGLTAYDTQRIKSEYLSDAWGHYDASGAIEKQSILDALGLYLNFVNLFQLMLSFLGSRQE